MRRIMHCFKGSLITIAALGTVFPPASIMAATQQSLLPRSNVRIVNPNTTFDISLNEEGKFQGRVVDHGGFALKGVRVSIKQGKTELAQATTDQDGVFVASNLRGGAYQVSAGATEGTYRLWTEKSAPPSAKPYCLLVQGENGVRGQCGAMCGSTGQTAADGSTTPPADGSTTPQLGSLPAGQGALTAPNNVSVFSNTFGVNGAGIVLAGAAVLAVATTLIVIDNNDNNTPVSP